MNGIACKLLSSKNPRKMRLGGVPTGVKIPPTVAPYAMANTNRIFNLEFIEMARANGISSKLVVVLERILDRTADVAVKDKIIPRGVYGKIRNILLITAR